MATTVKFTCSLELVSETFFNLGVFVLQPEGGRGGGLQRKTI